MRFKVNNQEIFASTGGWPFDKKKPLILVVSVVIISKNKQILMQERPKNKNFADNREQIYYLSEVSTREINEWLKIFKCL